MSKLAVTIDGHTHAVELDLGGSELEVKVDGEFVNVALPDREAMPKTMEWVLVNDRSYELVVDPDLRWMRGYGGLHHVEVQDQEAATARPHSGDGRVKAPIPGQITRVMVLVGQTVEVGQPLLILEAMKMENEIRAPCSGEVSALHVAPGQGVSLQEVLAEIT